MSGLYFCTALESSYEFLDPLFQTFKNISIWVFVIRFTRKILLLKVQVSKLRSSWKMFRITRFVFCCWFLFWKRNFISKSIKKALQDKLMNKGTSFSLFSLIFKTKSSNFKFIAYFSTVSRDDSFFDLSKNPIIPDSVDHLPYSAYR